MPILSALPVRSWRASHARWGATVCAVALLAVSLAVRSVPAAGEEAEGAAERVTLQLKWHHQFQFAGYYAAQMQGYYAAEGLEVDIVEGSAAQPPLQSVLAGRAQYGVTGADVLEARLRGEGVVVLAVIFQHSPYALLTRRDRGLTRPDDLIGKTVMLADDQGGTEFRAMLLAEGLSPEDVRIVEHSWSNADLIAGRADAISGYVSVEPFQIGGRGVDVAILRPVDYGVDFYGDSLFTTAAELSAHPERAAAIRRASLRGWEYAFAHVDELVAQILALPGARARGLTAAGLHFEAQRMRDLVLPHVIELGHINPGRWRRMADTYAQLGLAPADQSLDGFLYDPDPPIDRRVLGLALAAIAVLAALGGLFLLWNRQLQRLVRQRTAALERSEREQRQQHDVLQSVLDNMGDGVLVVDRDGKLILANPAAEQLHGSGADGRDRDAWLLAWRLFRPDGVTPYAADALPLARARRGEPSDAVEVRVRHPQRGEVILNTTSRPLRDADGEIRGGVAVLRDVTERQRAETAIRSLNAALEERVRERTSRLEIANRELEAFAYSVSHDLRAPLRHLQGFTQILLEDHAAALDEGARTLLERIGAAALRMGQITDALLGLSHLSSSAMACGAVDLSALATGIAAELRAGEPERAVDFDVAPGVVAHGDARLLRQLMCNLLENAWKYTSKRPTARIEFGVTTRAGAPVGGDRGAERIYFVRDDGVGFDATHAEDLFRPFKRLHRDAEFEGTGIGLATVQRIVHRHYGQVWAGSSPGRGATFYFTLAAAAAATAA